VKKTLKIDSSLYTILQILSVTLFEKTPILQALADSNCLDSKLVHGNQLTLFD
ncbi:MAG TPA: IS4 family transposase, partial [Deltaproteobacteria bacterium]|nr:IS4 family transposase [Deltaproteobacteria bacterium]